MNPEQADRCVEWFADLPGWRHQVIPDRDKRHYTGVFRLWNPEIVRKVVEDQHAYRTARPSPPEIGQLCRSLYRSQHHADWRTAEDEGPFSPPTEDFHAAKANVSRLRSKIADHEADKERALDRSR